MTNCQLQMKLGYDYVRTLLRMINRKLALKLLILSTVLQLPVCVDGNLRSRNRLHALNEHLHPEVYKEMLGNVDLLAPGNPLGHTNSLDYGAPCLKINPKACKGFPEIGCVWVEGNTYVCRCDFLHSWNETIGLCVPKVFAPCDIQEDSNDTINVCGLNMDCVPDFLSKKSDARICRCKQKFKIAYDEDRLPAFCVEDPQLAEDEEEDVLPVNISLQHKLNHETLTILLNVVVLLSSFLVQTQ